MSKVYIVTEDSREGGEVYLVTHSKLKAYSYAINVLRKANAVGAGADDVNSEHWPSQYAFRKELNERGLVNFWNYHCTAWHYNVCGISHLEVK